MFLSPVLVPDLRGGCYWLSAIIRYSRFIDNPPEKIFSLFGRLLGGRPDSSKSLRGCAFSLGYYHASTCAFSQQVQGLLIVNCASLRSLRAWFLETPDCLQYIGKSASKQATPDHKGTGASACDIFFIGVTGDCGIDIKICYSRHGDFLTIPQFFKKLKRRCHYSVFWGRSGSFDVLSSKGKFLRRRK